MTLCYCVDAQYCDSGITGEVYHLESLVFLTIHSNMMSMCETRNDYLIIACEGPKIYMEDDDVFTIFVVCCVV